jgi:hypothetical protein
LTIEYIKHNKLNFKKWDDCIRNSVNGNLYAFSWYLNIVSNNWDALIMNNYEAVMPLTHSKKYRIPFLIQPYFAQQLGVFSTHGVTPEIVKTFIDAIPNTFKYILINLNKYNQLSLIPANHKVNHNFELDLIFPHEQLIKKYSENTRRNIAKTKESGLIVTSNTCSVNDFVDLLKKNVGVKVENLPQNKYDDIQKIISYTLQGRFGEIISVYNKENELLAAVFFVFSHKKAIYLFAASTEEGKKERAMFLLVDEFIKKYAEKNLILDFEGSNIEGLARFYHGFGATDCEYLSIKINHLPFPLKLFKK